MPLYELFCLAKPGLGKRLGDVIKIAGRKVIDEGGVLTDIKYFGEQPTAYEIRKPGEKYSEASFWQLTFAVQPESLPQIDHALRVDERVLRWTFLKRRRLESLPNPYRIARAAENASNATQQSVSNATEP